MMEKLIVFILTALSVSVDLSKSEYCFQKGSCEHGKLLDYKITSGQIECQRFCSSIQDCKWYTYKPEEQLCGAFSTCDKLYTDLCPDCISSTVDCQLCDVPGELLGNFLDFFKVKGKWECHEKCETNKSCQWYTYHDHTCSIFESADGINKSLNNRVSSAKECSICPEGWTHLKNSCFKTVENRQNEKSAKLTCQKLNGHLADIKSPEINDLVTGLLLKDDQDYLTGGFGYKDTWLWSDRSPMEYTDWFKGVPHGEGNCVKKVKGQEYWYLTSCYTSYLYFICQIDLN